MNLAPIRLKKRNCWKDTKHPPIPVLPSRRTCVDLELLDPLDNMGSAQNSMFDETGNIQLTGGAMEQNPHWYAEVDEELQQEWNALVGTSNNETNQVEDIKVQVSGGKMISKESLHGVQVGSAGGWSLEVFRDLHHDAKRETVEDRSAKQSKIEEA
jgi:hypothetical protein